MFLVLEGRSKVRDKIGGDGLKEGRVFSCLRFVEEKKGELGRFILVLVRGGFLGFNY